MHYQIDDDVIKSENAAKPARQASHYVTQWLSDLNPTGQALDYGCGKLRYSSILAERFEGVTLVDSEIQLSRSQVIVDEVTTVREYVGEHWPRGRCLNVEEFRQDGERFGFALCANVLSAIPKRDVQLDVLSTIGDALLPDGMCLVVTQFRNSDFKKMASSPNATAHLDGFILRSKRGTSYYGLLTKDSVCGLIEEAGLRVIEAWTRDQSAYVTYRRP